MPDTAKNSIETHHLLIHTIHVCRSKGMPPGPVTPLASVVHAKGNPHVFFEVEARNVRGKLWEAAAFSALFDDHLSPLWIHNVPTIQLYKAYTYTMIYHVIGTMSHAICQDPYDYAAHLDERKARLPRNRWLPAHVGNTTISITYK